MVALGETETLVQHNSPPSLATLITRLEATSDAEVGVLADGIVQLLMSGARFPGFWSGEIIAPKNRLGSKEWRLIQRFDADDQATSWKDSEIRKHLLKELDKHTTGDAADELVVGPENGGGVATAIITDVKPETQDEYFAWEIKIKSAQAKYPGYEGIYLQPPLPGRPGQWTTLLRFDSPASLEKWFESEERRTLVEEAEKMVESTRFQRMTGSFPGWFPVDKETGKGPPNWKAALLVMLGLFPIVMLEIWLLSPMETTWNSSVRTFINLMISVSFTSFVSMPLCVKWFDWWLLPPKDAPASGNLRGIVIVTVLLIVQVLLLWNLLK